MGGEVLDDAALHLEELVRATRDFAQRHDAGIADDGAQRREVAIGATGLAGGEGSRVLPEPLYRRPVGRGWGGAAGKERDDDQSDGASAQPRARGAHAATSNVELELETDQESVHRRRASTHGLVFPSAARIRIAPQGTGGHRRLYMKGFVAADVLLPSTP